MPTATAASGGAAGVAAASRREGAAPARGQDDADARRAARPSKAPAAEDGEADEDEGDEQPGVARGDQAANGERRPRRRGRRGGRRRRGNGLEDGLVGSIADELGPTSAPEVDQRGRRFRRRLVRACAHAGAEPTSQPEPVARSRRRCAAWRPMSQPRDRSSSAPAPAAEETAQEAERAAARRRSTVREKVSFVTSAPAEPAPAVSHSAAGAGRRPCARCDASRAGACRIRTNRAPRKAGWWSRRFGSGE